MPEPTIQESSRLLDGLLRSGTIRRLDMLHQALCHAYQLGRKDEKALNAPPIPGEGCEG